MIPVPLFVSHTSLLSVRHHSLHGAGPSLRTNHSTESRLEQSPTYRNYGNLGHRTHSLEIGFPCAVFLVSTAINYQCYILSYIRASRSQSRDVLPLHTEETVVRPTSLAKSWKRLCLQIPGFQRCRGIDPYQTQPEDPRISPDHHEKSYLRAIHTLTHVGTLRVSETTGNITLMFQVFGAVVTWMPFERLSWTFDVHDAVLLQDPHGWWL